MMIIGISGYVGSGKTTTSDWFIGNHGFKRLSFADPIRNMIMALGIPEATLRDPELKEQPHKLLLGRSPRYAMEKLGKEWGRELMHPQFWIGQFAAKADTMKFVICDDVRYPNEVEAIHALGGKVYKLIVPGQEARVASDYAVQTVFPDEALTNDPGAGVTQKKLYEYIYSRTFRPDDRLEPPGMKLDRYAGIPLSVRAELMAAQGYPGGEEHGRGPA